MSIIALSPSSSSLAAWIRSFGLDSLSLTNKGMDTATGSELWLGWAVLWFVVIGVLYGVIALLTNRMVHIPRKWMNWLFPSISAIGLAVALYIAYVQLFQVQAICGPLQDCNSVLQSRYAKLLGFIPNSVLGTLSYLALFVLWGWQARRRDWVSHQVPVLIFAITLLGSLLSIFLTLIQVTILKALCIWCLSSAVIIVLLFLLSLSLFQLDDSSEATS